MLKYMMKNENTFILSTDHCAIPLKSYMLKDKLYAGKYTRHLIGEKDYWTHAE